MSNHSVYGEAVIFSDQIGSPVNFAIQRCGKSMENDLKNVWKSLEFEVHERV